MCVVLYVLLFLLVFCLIKRKYKFIISNLLSNQQLAISNLFQCIFTCLLTVWKLPKRMFISLFFRLFIEVCFGLFLPRSFRVDPTSRRTRARSTGPRSARSCAPRTSSTMSPSFIENNEMLLELSPERRSSSSVRFLQISPK